MLLLPAKLQPFAKAVYALLSSFLTLLTAQVVAANPHTIGAIDTVGWLSIGGGTLLIAGGVLAITNVSTSSVTTDASGATTTSKVVTDANVPANMTVTGNLPDPVEPKPASRAVPKRSGRRS